MNDAPDDEDFDPVLRRTVGKLAGLLSSDGGLPSGDVAELRRIDPDEPYTPALWKLMVEFDLEEHPYWLSSDERETRWAALLMGMAMTPTLHDYNVPLGEALAESGWSELRFVRLMRSRDTDEDHRLVEEVRRMAQYLASKDQQADWTDVGHLLFSQTGEPAENYRRQIARDYYRQLYREEAAAEA